MAVKNSVLDAITPEKGPAEAKTRPGAPKRASEVGHGPSWAAGTVDRAIIAALHRLWSKNVCGDLCFCPTTTIHLAPMPSRRNCRALRSPSTARSIFLRRPPCRRVQRRTCIGGFREFVAHRRYGAGDALARLGADSLKCRMVDFVRTGIFSFPAVFCGRMPGPKPANPIFVGGPTHYWVSTLN